MMASMEAVSDATVVVTVVHDCQVSHIFLLPPLLDPSDLTLTVY